MQPVTLAKWRIATAARHRRGENLVIPVDFAVHWGTCPRHEGGWLPFLVQGALCAFVRQDIYFLGILPDGKVVG